MNPLLKNVGYGLGAVSLVGASFLGVAAMSGTPMSKLPAIGGLFPPPAEGEAEPVPDGPPPVDAREELSADRRSVGQVFDRARSPLQAFLLESPFSAGELEALEARLEARLRELDLREQEIARREVELEEEREHYDALFAELEGLRTELARRADEQRARADELSAERGALEETERESFRMLAAIYAEGKARDMAGMLTQVYGPDQAALVLAACPEDRAAELLAQIHKEDPARGALYVEAYRRAKTPQAPTAK